MPDSRQPSNSQRGQLVALPRPERPANVAGAVVIWLLLGCLLVGGGIVLFQGVGGPPPWCSSLMGEDAVTPPMSGTCRDDDGSETVFDLYFARRVAEAN